MNATTTETESELKSSILPADGTKAPARITLKRGVGPGEWITRQENVHNGQEFSAHYFSPIGSLGGAEGAYKRALRNYARRCTELGVVAFQRTEVPRERHATDSSPAKRRASRRNDVRATGATGHR